MDFRDKQGRCKKWQRCHGREEDDEDGDKRVKTHLPPRVVRVYSLNDQQDNDNGQV